MAGRAYRTSIPAGAGEVVEERHPGVARKSASYFVAGEKVGREWDEEGRPEFEYALRGGVKHGREYRFYPNGRPVDEDNCRDGRPHGVGRQWAEDGRLLVRWKLVNGTGLDLWCNDDGTLAEEHYRPKDRVLESLCPVGGLPPRNDLARHRPHQDDLPVQGEHHQGLMGLPKAGLSAGITIMGEVLGVGGILPNLLSWEARGGSSSSSVRRSQDDGYLGGTPRAVLTTHDVLGPARALPGPLGSPRT
jgi:hypothetical protein